MCTACLSLFLANANILSLHNIYTKTNIYNIGRNVRSVTCVETVKTRILVKAVDRNSALDHRKELKQTNRLTVLHLLAVVTHESLFPSTFGIRTSQIGIFFVSRLHHIFYIVQYQHCAGDLRLCFNFILFLTLGGFMASCKVRKIYQTLF